MSAKCCLSNSIPSLQAIMLMQPEVLYLPCYTSPLSLDPCT